MYWPSPAPTATSVRTTSLAASTAHEHGNVASSVNSKPSDTRSPSNPLSRSRSPHRSPTNPTPSRVADPCVQDVPGRRSYVSDRNPDLPEKLKAEADAVLAWL